MSTPFTVHVQPDWEGLIRCIKREGTPNRVHHIELFLDLEVQAAICDRYDLLRDLDPQDPYFDLRRQITLQRFLGYDYVRCGLEGLEMPLHHTTTEDTAGLRRETGRTFMEALWRSTADRSRLGKSSRLTPGPTPRLR